MIECATRPSGPGHRHTGKCPTETWRSPHQGLHYTAAAGLMKTQAVKSIALALTLDLTVTLVLTQPQNPDHPL